MAKEKVKTLAEARNELVQALFCGQQGERRINKALDTIEGLFTDASKDPKLRLEAAKWMAEQGLGRAAQRVEVTDGEGNPAPAVAAMFVNVQQSMLANPLIAEAYARADEILANPSLILTDKGS